MGNPFIRSEAFQPASADPAPSANGILAKVPAEFIAAGAKQLPQAAAGQSESAEALLQDLPHLGAVRISYRLNTYRHGKSRHWHWVAVRADQV